MPVPLDPTIVSRELGVLRRLLAEVEPEYASAVQAVSVADDASLAEKLYWQEIGFWDGLVVGVQPPHEVDTEATLAAVIERWSALELNRSFWGPEGAARCALPTRCRVLSLNLSAPEVTLIDETDGLEDPNVIAIGRDGQRKERGPFLRYIVDTTLAQLFAERHFKIHVPASLLGAPMMPTLAPRLSKLGDGIWHTVPFPERRRPMGPSREFIGYTSYRVLVAFLEATADSGWFRSVPIADRYDLDTVPETLLTSNRLTTIRDAERQSTFRAGTIAGRPVIMLPEGKGESIYVQPEDRPVVIQEVKRHGARGALIDRLDDLRYERDGKRYMRLP